MYYQLTVSHNCGSTYVPEQWAENPSELDSRCDELDAQGLRWAIEDENGRPVYRTCAIHVGIITFMERANAEALAQIEARLADLKPGEEMRR